MPRRLSHHGTSRQVSCHPKQSLHAFGHSLRCLGLSSRRTRRSELTPGFSFDGSAPPPSTWAVANRACRGYLRGDEHNDK